MILRILQKLDRVSTCMFVDRLFAKTRNRKEGKPWLYRLQSAMDTEGEERKKDEGEK